MTKPKGEGPPESEEPEDPLRKELREKGLTEDQIDDMVIRLNAEEIFAGDPLKKEPNFLYEVFEEKFGRPLTDVEKMEIKAAFDQDWKEQKKHYGVDDEGKTKKD
jgi:hypothetical protein